MRKSNYALKNILAILFMSTFAGFAQNNEREQENTIEVISVVERSIPQSARHTEQPEIIDTVIPKPTVEFPFLIKKYQDEITLDSIKPIKLSLPYRLKPLDKGYARVGFGSTLSPLVDLSYGSDRNRKYDYSIGFHHYSTWLNLKEYPTSTFDLNDLRLSGTYFSRNVVTYGGIDFYNNGYHHYGLPGQTDIPGDSIRTRFNSIGAKIGFKSPIDSTKLLYDFNIGYNNFLEQPKIDSANKVRENLIQAGLDLFYLKGRTKFSVGLNLIDNVQQYQLYNADTNQLSNNFIFKIRPLYSSYGREKKWKAHIGFEFVGDFRSDTTNRFGFFPIAHAEYTLFNGIFVPYIGINGEHNLNSYKNISEVNPHMLSQIGYRNEFKDFNTYVGIKGKLSRNMWFDAGVQLSRIRDLLLFVNDSIEQNLFTPVYDTAYKFTIKTELSYSLGERINAGIVGEYNFYSMQNETNPWNLPVYKITLNGSYNIRDKFYVKAEIFLEGGRKAKPTFLRNGITELPEFYDLGFLADCNLSFEYRYSPRLSAFVQLNNFAAQKYQRYLNYPVYGFQALIGFTFGF